jgi:hypothetical protein
MPRRNSTVLLCRCSFRVRQWRGFLLCVGQPRATQRYQPVEVDDFERRLTTRILKLKRMEKYRRSGCIKITRKLHDEGWAVNGKRVHRLWKKLGLQVPRKQRKRRAVGFKDNACDRLKATRPNQVWSYDFVRNEAFSDRAEVRRSLVNIGAPWPDRQTPKSRVLAMQTKLHRWAVGDSDRRFDDLFNLVYDPAFLAMAWYRVRGNKGRLTAGVDGVAPSAKMKGDSFR